MPVLQYGHHVQRLVISATYYHTDLYADGLVKKIKDLQDLEVCGNNIIAIVDKYKSVKGI